MKKLGFILTVIFLCLTAFHFLVLKEEKYETTDMYEELMQRRYIKVGINTDVQPVGFINKNGEYDGYNADIAKNIAKYLFNDFNAVKFIEVTPSNRLIKLSTGDIDIVIASMTITPERKQIINFSIPYDMAAQTLLVKKSSKVTGMNDLIGENVGVIWGTTAEKNMQKQFANINIIGFKNYTDAYNALVNDKVTAITSDDTILNSIALMHKDVKLLPYKYSKEPYGIGFRKGKGSDRLRKELNFAISDMKQKGVQNRIRKKWFE